MPAGDSLGAALRVMEWAYGDPEPLELDPAGALAYRALCDRGLADEAAWREALDAALVIWTKGYDRHQFRSMF